MSSLRDARLTGDEAIEQPAPGGSGGGRAASTGPDEAPRPPSWRALITGLLMALVIATIMVTTYVSAQHVGVARDRPWGVSNALYFDGNAIPQQVDLSVYVVVAAALVTLSTHGRLRWRRGQTTPTHQPRRRGPYCRHSARMHRPRPVSRRRDRVDQEPFDTPAGCRDGSAGRRLAGLPLLPEFPGSARGTT